MSQRRPETRRRTLLSGRLIFNRLSTLDCIVRDLSPTGARLVCKTTGLGDSATLEIKSADGVQKKNARIVWRRPEDCGVEFV